MHAASAPITRSQRSTTPPAPPAEDFDATTRVEPSGRPGEYVADVSAAWSNSRTIHGGSLAAIAVHAVQAEVADRHVRTILTNFSRPAVPGPARVEVEVVHAGRSLTSAIATITQEGRVVATTRATLAVGLTGPEWSRPRHRLIMSVDECVPIEPPPPRPAHFDMADGLLDPTSLPFSGGPEASVRGYVRPNPDRPIDAAWLAMACDWFPPAAFVQLAPPAGMVSIDLVTHVHATLPPLGDGWLTAWFDIERSAGGLAVEHGQIATPDGLLLAESFHTRWTADVVGVAG